MRRLLQRDGGHNVNKQVRRVSPQELFDIAQRVQIERQAAIEDFLREDVRGGGAK
jgi:hypothetical protein